ncbi:MAG: RagB/SusD family nutrient uptake outer membrane protein [Dysgonamonadaceae bacterium]|jgi:hypothetical protein|nr:RagB/SusD family nutrient uptake outer membrane protein [Dysgonamonadaceae bacterium]
MKKWIYIVGVIGLLTSCNDYFNPGQSGNIEAEKFYKDLNSLRIGLNGVFNLLQSQSYQVSEIMFGEAMSDNSWNIQDVEINDAGQLVNFQFNNDNPHILNRYQVNYQGINKANQIIRSASYVNYRANGASEKEIREVLGQAKLFRALFYFNLVKTFGGVSIQPEDVNLENMIVPRSSVDEIFAYIEKDLREAILILRRNRYQQSEAGQVGVGGALGLLMKALVYEASPGIKTVNVNKEAKWREALEIGQLFIDGKDITYDRILKFPENYDESWEELSARLTLDPASTPSTVFKGQDVVSIHQLEPLFNRIFKVAGEFCLESIIEINHYDYSASGSSIDESWPCAGSIINAIGGTASIIAVTPTSDLTAQFQNDPRGLFTYTGRSLNTYYTQEETSPQIGWFNYGNAMVFVKYYIFPSEGGYKNRNYRIMRYAEVLLLYAEILNETGDSKRAVDFVNAIRTRARRLIDEYPQYITISKNNFKDVPYAPYSITKDAILKEKRVEMAGEFDRWFEIARLGILNERMISLSNNPPVEQPSGKVRVRGLYFRKGVNEVFPIPQKEVIISNGIIEQNFGY